MAATVTSSGGFAEESARLLAAFQEWAASSARPRPAGAGADGADAEPAGSSDRHGPDCALCPICQGLSLLRGARPEVMDHLAEAMTSLAAAVAALLPTEPPASERRAAERVQHIDVTGDEQTGAGA